MDEMVYRQVAIDAVSSIMPVAKLADGDAVIRMGAVNHVLNELPSAQPEQPKSEDITFWKKRAREYEGMIKELVDEMARGIKIDSVLITEEGIVFKKEKPEQRWIPVSERLPEDRDWVLGIFQEGDTRWINPIPFICDYVGKKTPITTQDNWLLKMVDEPHPYYEKLHCIAWMPLPEPYAERREG